MTLLLRGDERKHSLAVATAFAASAASERAEVRSRPLRNININITIEWPSSRAENIVMLQCNAPRVYIRITFEWISVALCVHAFSPLLQRQTMLQIRLKLYDARTPLQYQDCLSWYKSLSALSFVIRDCFTSDPVDDDPCAHKKQQSEQIQSKEPLYVCVFESVHEHSRVFMWNNDDNVVVVYRYTHLGAAAAIAEPDRATTIRGNIASSAPGQGYPN
ncbi:unnamed protein product [Trichogramma brassicae]|uniref:Uncharacterized protein n=1 Tax=Trichogramma brassicae TaxID=86971 RepID=A0A6H5IVX0_9HYME|nr:unnamed protein product [Trichogramma brassicae]